MSKSKCCNCCHNGVQAIDKEKVKAVLVGTFCVPFLTFDLNYSSTCCELTQSCPDRSVTFVNTSPNDWHMFGNQFATDRWLMADQSQIGCATLWRFPPFSWSNRSPHHRRPIWNYHKTSLRPLGDQWNLSATKLVAVIFFCMWPIGDLLAPSIKPFRDLWDCLRLSILLVAKWSHRSSKLCVTGV